jgi:hypothetical protein
MRTFFGWFGLVLGGVLIGRIWQRGGMAWDPAAPADSARPDEFPRS